VLAPVSEGREESLRATLDRLPAGGQSPLARVPGLHFSRWVIVPDLVYGAEPQRPDHLERPQLIFTSTFDGPLDQHLSALLDGLGATADEVWGHCAGWPGRAAAKAWLRAHRVRPGLFVAAYPEASVAEVHRALDARARLLALAEDAQGADAEATRRRFVQEFG